MPQLQVLFEIPPAASTGDDRQTKYVEAWLVENFGFVLPRIQRASKHRNRRQESSGDARNYASRISFLAVPIARRGLVKSYREVQPRLLTAFFGAKVDGISFMHVHPFDFVPARENPAGGTEPSSIKQESGGRFRRKMAFTAEETRHHFAIEALDKPGSFRPQPYLYTCVRCRWIFRINDSRGSIIALDGLGRRLPEPENSKRIVTFHRGPCPAFPVIEYLVPEVDRESRLPKDRKSVV